MAEESKNDMVHDGSGEPTMEEILASIRRIISEDEGEENAPAQAAQSEENVQNEEDILDLTEMVEENDTVEESEPEQSFAQVAEEVQAQQQEPEEPAPMAEEQASEQTETAETAEIVGDQAADKTRGKFAELAKTVNARGTPIGGHNTLEDLTRELMRPYLKDWLDKNLPRLVEKMVSAEIEKLSREAEYFDDFKK